MKSFILLSSVLLMLVSCTSNDNSSNAKTDSEATQPVETAKVVSDLSGCYLRVLKRDTLALSVQQSGRTITGKLSFDNFEKDGSSGTVSGMIDNDILKLIYSFQSEGMHSVMEAYFKIEDSSLIHGIGEVATRSDTTYFAHPNDISYPAPNRLVKISCDKLDQKYK